MEKTNKASVTVLLATVPMYIMAVYYYGARVLLCAAVTMAVSYILNCILCRLHGRTDGTKDISPLLTGAVLTLMFPASCPLWLPVAASVFGIAAVKIPFGGTGKNIFSPEAAGFCFCAVAWTEQTFSYPAVGKLTELFSYGKIPVRASSSVAAALRSGMPHGELIDILLGNTRGPCGACAAIILLGCALFVAARGSVSFKQTLSILLSAAVFAFLFPRGGLNRGTSVALELSSGFLLFGAVFLAGDDSSSPSNELGKVFFGIFIGILTMLFRYFGKFEVGFPFALIIANAIVPFFDKHAEGITRSVKKRIIRMLKKADKKRRSRT